MQFRINFYDEDGDRTSYTGTSGQSFGRVLEDAINHISDDGYNYTLTTTTHPGVTGIIYKLTPSVTTGYANQGYIITNGGVVYSQAEFAALSTTQSSCSWYCKLYSTNKH